MKTPPLDLLLISPAPIFYAIPLGIMSIASYVRSKGFSVEILVDNIWGLVVNEVMNAGKAVIVSDHVGCDPNLVRNGGNGYTFPRGDIPALAAALSKGLADPGTCRRMGTRSRDIISPWGFSEDLAGLRQALQAVMADP